MNAEERNSKATEEMQSDLEKREEDRRKNEAGQQEELNQGMQTGTRDATHAAVEWGASYKTPRKAGKRGRTKKTTGGSESKR
jgi:hypothetical protein